MQTDSRIRLIGLQVVTDVLGTLGVVVFFATLASPFILAWGFK